MGKLISILFLIIQVGMSGEYPLKNGKPTSEGIKQYVEENAESLVREYQQFVGDTLYNVWIYAEELDDEPGTESMELGWHFPHEIYISTVEKFEAYELENLTPHQRSRFKESNKFVRGVMIHELTHEYVNQIGVEMQAIFHIAIDPSYKIDLWIVNSHENFGSTFIEEGISEYMVEKMGELIPPLRMKIPLTVKDLLKRENQYMVRYKYSSLFLKAFLDTTGFKKGVQILLYNPPPTYEEILQAERFFRRLEVPQILSF